ncbi:MAG: hypothetical protein C4524_07660 [Candidatus Zixiibacteriota bacterium]|nr:MAG: hypothetical protein C4524_07660 [candidate division Zixibacteria bacterium]
MKSGIYIAAALTLLACMAGETRALENFGGSLRLIGSSQSSPAADLRSFDQQYQVHYSRHLLPLLLANVAVSYHDLQTFPAQGDRNWHGEFQPSADLSWTSPFFTAGANYRYRETRDLVAVNNSLNRGAGAYLRTRFTDLPQANVTFDWNRYVSHSGFMPLDSEERRLQAGLQYARRVVNLRYTYSHRDFENRVDGSRQVHQQHIVRTDYSDNFINQRLRLAGSYLFSYNLREESSSQSALPLSLIPALQGLYALDNSPGLGELDTLAALVDDNLNQVTIPPVDIGGANIYQNLGLNLGLPRPVDHLFIYTDRQSDPAVAWTVYTSDNNLDWTVHGEGVSQLYNVAAQRYEIAFAAVTARYLKVVNTGINEEPQVFVTEMQALLSSEALGTLPGESANHRATVSTSYQVNSTVRLGADAVLGSLVENSTGQERRDASVAGTATYRPTAQFSVVGRYQQGYTEYRNELVQPQMNKAASLTVLGQPLKTLELSLSGSYQETAEDQVVQQVTKSSLARASAQLLPGLSAITEAGFTRGLRPAQDQVIDTWSYRQSVEAFPYASLNLTAGYGVQWYSSNQAYSANRRDETDLRLTWRATASIHLRGHLTYAREDANDNFSQDYSLGWHLTERLSANAGARFFQTDTGYSTRSLSLQTAYLLSSRTNFSFGYSQNRIENSQVEETTTYQAGFNTSF